MVELVCEGSIINGATPSSLLNFFVLLFFVSFRVCNDWHQVAVRDCLLEPTLDMGPVQTIFVQLDQ